MVGAAVATGFTLTENARFFLTAPTLSVFEDIVLGRTFVPVHVVLTCAACMTAAAGWTSRGHWWWAYGGVGLVVATSLHAGVNLRLEHLPSRWLDGAVTASFVMAALGLLATGAVHRRRGARVGHLDEPRR